MTWRFKVQGVVTAVLVLGSLALAAGAQWVDGLSNPQWIDASTALWQGLGW